MKQLMTAVMVSTMMMLFLAGCGEESQSVQEWKTTDSGIKYKILHAGTGPSPKDKDQVKCHYRGWLNNGKEFDSSIKRGTPATFSVSGVIPGWTEMLKDMKVGEKRQVKIPSKLGYGARGSAEIPPNAPLNFEMELLEIVGKK